MGEGNGSNVTRRYLILGPFAPGENHHRLPLSMATDQTR
ncbi:hypothetical protein GFS31_25240 [Leptolyngbya sp. BL0902]|nr:hypothetical protein GFS31_25240 [Leptolyngbya sp. BL0902]